MTKTASDVLLALAPPPGIVRFIEAEIERRQKAGQKVSDKTLVWLQTWDRLWAGLPVPEVDTLTDEEWQEIGEIAT